MQGKPQIELYKGFAGRSEADILAFLAGKNLHCVKCKANLKGNEAFAYTIKNDLSIHVRSESGIKSGVPALVCVCGYENTLIKLLAQV